MGQTGITVNQLPDLPAALQMIEEKTGSRPGGTEEKALCRLLSEELLMHLLRAGYTDAWCYSKLRSWHRP